MAVATLSFAELAAVYLGAPYLVEDPAKAAAAENLRFSMALVHMRHYPLDKSHQPKVHWVIDDKLEAPAAHDAIAQRNLALRHFIGSRVTNPAVVLVLSNLAETLAACGRVDGSVFADVRAQYGEVTPANVDTYLVNEAREFTALGARLFPVAELVV